jgi:hypothetical protein
MQPATITEIDGWRRIPGAFILWSPDGKTVSLYVNRQLVHERSVPSNLPATAAPGQLESKGSPE